MYNITLHNFLKKGITTSGVEGFILVGFELSKLLCLRLRLSAQITFLQQNHKLYLICTVYIFTAILHFPFVVFSHTYPVPLFPQAPSKMCHVVIEVFGSLVSNILYSSGPENENSSRYFSGPIGFTMQSDGFFVAMPFTLLHIIIRFLSAA